MPEISPLNARLVQAVLENNAGAVQELLQKGANANAVISSTKERPLHLAARHADETLSVVRLLYHAGADINAQNVHGHSVLDAAVSHGNLPLTQWLISHKARVNKFDRYKNTPLILAVQQCNAEIVKALILAGADVKKQGRHDRTPFFWAAYTQHWEIGELLVSAGGFSNKNMHVKTDIFISDKSVNSRIKDFTRIMKEKYGRLCRQTKTVQPRSKKIVPAYRSPYRSTALKSLARRQRER